MIQTSSVPIKDHSDHNTERMAVLDLKLWL